MESWALFNLLVIKHSKEQVPSFKLIKGPILIDFSYKSTYNVLTFLFKENLSIS